MENREGGSVIGDGIRVSYLWGWSGNPAVVATSNSSSMRKGSKFRSAKLPMLRRTSAPCPSACSRDRITCNPEKKKKKTRVFPPPRSEGRGSEPRGQSTRIHVPEAVRAFLSCEVHASQVRALKARAVLVSGASRYGSIRQRWYPTGALQSLSYICTRRSYTAV